MAICHALDHKAAAMAVDAGVDGLIHTFYDVADAPEVVEKIAKSGIWLTTTIVTLGALAGEVTGENIGNDPHAMEHVPESLRNNIHCCWVPHRQEPASLENAISVTRALHKAGVPLLAGTDACGLVGLGAVYGVSFHGELRFLVQAGLTPLEALRAGSSTPAVKFGLKDRGFVRPGYKADLVLVHGDPTQRIEDAVRIEEVWRNGERLDRAATATKVAELSKK